MAETEVDQRYLVSLVGRISGWDNPHEKLRKAFAQDEFVLYSQSILKLGAGSERRPHFEIFVRLLEEEEQLVPPGSFLPMLEYCNLGPTLDRHVVTKLVATFGRRQPAQWGVAHVNLCASAFDDRDFCEHVAAELLKAAVPAECLCFEFPGTLADAPAHAKTLARDLKKIGCRIAVGAGESDGVDFAAVGELQADYLKFGGGLVRELPDNAVAAAQLKTAARACRGFHVQTIATHVESAPALKLLREFGVEFAQGYGIAKPVPFDTGPVARAR